MSSVIFSAEKLASQPSAGRCANNKRPSCAWTCPNKFPRDDRVTPPVSVEKTLWNCDDLPCGRGFGREERSKIVLQTYYYITGDHVFVLYATLSYYEY